MEQESLMNEIPSVLPDIENEGIREQLQQSEPVTDGKSEYDDDDPDEESFPSHAVKQRNSFRWIRNVAAFAIFLFVMVLGIAWFFGIGWFSKAKPDVVNRNGQKSQSASPQTEDEKLKAALSMVASKEPKVSSAAPDQFTSETDPASSYGASNDPLAVQGSETRSRPPTTQLPESNAPNTNQFMEVPLKETSKPSPAKSENMNFLESTKTKTTEIEPIGRSLFFGISNIYISPDPRVKEITENKSAKFANENHPDRIPFGTLIPVRLIGSIFTLQNGGQNTGRNSGRGSDAYVRLELTLPIQGKDYNYPAGTVFVGNIRADEAARAFVSIVGLIDPISGAFVKCVGDLLGSDGASGIIGKRKSATGNWSRLLRGLKNTASSVVNSVGSFRGGSTIVFSDQMRKGSSSVGEEVSESLLQRNSRESFVAVSAGTSGYILVTELPVTSASIGINDSELREVDPK